MRYHKHSRHVRRVERAIASPAREISRPNGLHPWIAAAVGIVGSLIVVIIGIGGGR